MNNAISFQIKGFAYDQFIICITFNLHALRRNRLDLMLPNFLINVLYLELNNFRYLSLLIISSTLSKLILNGFSVMICDIVTHELRVVNYELRVDTLKARVGIQKCELRVTSSNSRIAN